MKWPHRVSRPRIGGNPRLPGVATNRLDEMITPFAIMRWILGTVLLAAALLKGHQLATGLVDGGSLLSTRWFMIFVVELELGMAAWLFSGYAPAALRRAGILVFSALCGVALAKGLVGETSCGCWGRWAVSPWVAAALDAAAVAASFGARCPTLQRRVSSRPSRGLALAAGLWALVALPAGLAMAGYEPAHLTDDGRIVGAGRHVVLEPGRWVGRRFPLSDHLEIQGDLSTERWIVVLVDPDCPLCRQAVAQYRQIAADLADHPGAPRLALITLRAAGADELLAASGEVTLVGRLSDRLDWHVEAPLELTLRDGVVTRVRTQVMPSLGDFASL